jgi:hypothetical protein
LRSVIAKAFNHQRPSKVPPQKEKEKEKRKKGRKKKAIQPYIGCITSIYMCACFSSQRFKA